VHQIPTKQACKPSSVPLAGRQPSLWGASYLAPLATLPGRSADHVNSPLFGLAPGGVYLADQSPGRWCALTAPFHPYSSRYREERFNFCGTFLGVTPTGRYPAPCPVELGLSSRAKAPATTRPALYSFVFRISIVACFGVKVKGDGWKQPQDKPQARANFRRNADSMLSTVSSSPRKTRSI
jgi:hypothetical protein